MSRNEWTNPREYLVPRDLPFSMPKEWDYAGLSGVRGLVGKGRDPFSISWSMWPGKLPEAKAVLIISAVQARLVIRRSSARWPAPPFVEQRLLTRKPLITELPHGCSLEAIANGARSGEVWCWPLKRSPTGELKAQQDAARLAAMRRNDFMQ